MQEVDTGDISGRHIFQAGTVTFARREPLCVYFRGPECSSRPISLLLLPPLSHLF